MTQAVLYFVAPLPHIQNYNLGVYLSAKRVSVNGKVKLSPLGEFLDEIHEHPHAPSQIERQVTKVKAGIKR